jgi:molybdenum cofactor biosynthesis protein B, proteobacterial
MPGIDETRTFIPLNLSILTISDTRTIEEDTSGAFLVQAATSAGHHIHERTIVRDDIWAIRAHICRWVASGSCDVIISTGGTGLTGRDVTIEAVRPLLDKVVDGFAHLFHEVSRGHVGTSTMQSRAMGGLAGQTYIFCLPGSTGACKDGWNSILHYQLDSRHRPCNLSEIIPRLSEH